VGDLALATFLAGAILLASTISVELGLSVAYYALDWSRRGAEIGGLALSTTRLGVVYAGRARAG